MKQQSNYAKARSGKQARKEIARLQAALNREKRENVRLREKLIQTRRALDQQNIMEEDHLLPLRRRKDQSPRLRQEHLAGETANRAEAFERTTYFSYVFHQFTASTVYRIVSKFFRYFRHIRLVRNIMIIGTLLFTTVVLSTLYIMILPFILFFSVLSVALGLITTRRMNCTMMKELQGKHLRVIVPSDEASLEPDSFLILSAREMAAQKNTAVIFVTPHTLSTRGVGSGRGPFFTARKEDQDLFIVRKHYFFSLRRHVLELIDPDMTIMY